MGGRQSNGRFVMLGAARLRRPNVFSSWASNVKRGPFASRKKHIKYVLNACSGGLVVLVCISDLCMSIRGHQVLSNIWPVSNETPIAQY